MAPQGPRILIVDDSEDDTLLAASRLRRALPGMSMRRVDSPETMRQALDGGEWDLVISDHAMPRFDSLGALEVLKASGKSIPFIVYSGHYDRDQGLEALRAGVRDFVQKNDPGRLVPVVRRELGAPGSAAAEPVRLDPVTGLAGASWLLAQVDAAIAAHDAAEPAFALLRIDLDRFHRINRAFGATMGDRLLADVTGRLRHELAACDHLARGDEDEFLCLLDRVGDPIAGLRRAERALRSLDEPFLRDGNAFYVTASAGLAVFPVHGRSAAQLFSGAASGLERARTAGINRAAFAPEVAANEAGAEGGAIVPVSGLFVLAHPIVAIASRRTWGVEATVRRRQDGLVHVIPDLDAPISPSRPGVETVSAWLLEESLRLAERLRGGGLADGRVSLNLSQDLFLDPTAPDLLAARLARAGLPSDTLEIEIPERWVLGDTGRVLAAARRYRAAGMRLALDEFGTNYGPLAPLQSLAVDTLKLAPALVREARAGEAGDGALRGAIALARAMGVAVVAVGAETEEDCERLASLGIDRAQGPAYPPRRIETAPLLPASFEPLPVQAARRAS